MCCQHTRRSPCRVRRRDARETRALCRQPLHCLPAPPIRSCPFMPPWTDGTSLCYANQVRSRRRAAPMGNDRTMSFKEAQKVSVGRQFDQLPCLPKTRDSVGMRAPPPQPPPPQKQQDLLVLLERTSFSRFPWGRSSWIGLDLNTSPCLAVRSCSASLCFAGRVRAQTSTSAAVRTLSLKHRGSPPPLKHRACGTCTSSIYRLAYERTSAHLATPHGQW